MINGEHFEFPELLILTEALFGATIEAYKYHLLKKIFKNENLMSLRPLPIRS